MLKPAEIQIGIVGLGLMGRSILVDMLAAGHSVIGITPIKEDLAAIQESAISAFLHCRELGLTTIPFEHVQHSMIISDDYSLLANCSLVVECVIEDLEIKRKVLGKIDQSIRAEAIIGTNTSAIPVSVLQDMVSRPERFVGIHWAEPAYLTRFLEIICGDKTDLRIAGNVYDLAVLWRKEPTVLRKDLPGFITNRLMYAVFREVFAQVEAGVISLEDIDKCFRYDAGSWITLMGVFRRWDYLGLNHLEGMDKLFGKLSNRTTVPEILKEIVKTEGRGVSNCNGLYPYTPDSASAWAEAFARFNEDIYDLASEYPAINPEKP